MAWREEGGADFNPVASGLRQFVFQPRLESQRQASLTSQNRNRAGKSVCGRADLPRCLFPTPGLDPRSFALLFPAPGKALSLQIEASEPSQRVSVQHLGQNTQQKMAPISTSREEFGKQVTQLRTAIVP